MQIRAGDVSLSLAMWLNEDSADKMLNHRANGILANTRTIASKSAGEPEVPTINYRH